MPRNYTPRQATISRACLACGATFAVTANRAREGRGLCCTRPCLFAWQRSNQTVRRCRQCGARFTVFRSDTTEGRGVFCGAPCYNAARGQRVYTCDVCGIECLSHPYRLREGRRFCGVPCRTADQRKGREDRFWARVNKDGPVPPGRPALGPCWLWMGSRDPRGYGLAHRAGLGNSAHRCAYVLAYGEFDRSLSVLHECDNPPCCNPAHLHLGTQVDNMREAVIRGRMPAGEVHPQARLTDEKIRAIRARYAAGGITHKVLAREYRVGRGTICKILTRKSWGHVT